MCVTLCTSSVGQTETASAAIVKTIADAKDVEPTELEPVLEDYIDTDAVDRLVSRDDASWTLTFELPEHTVTVTNEEVIRVNGKH